MNWIGWEMKKIMVVDDDPDIIYSIREGLFTEYEIICAESGKQCLKILETEIPDIILLDIMMPYMSGWKTLNQIRKNTSLRNVPIVFITARTDKNAKEAGSFLGDEYLEKPFSLNHIMAIINKYIKTRKKK